MASRQAHRVSLDTGEWLSLGVPADRTRGWRVLSGLLAIGALTFALSLFLPLYQSKQTLQSEYARLAAEASTAQTQLAAGVAAFAMLKQERDALRGTARAAEARESQRVEQMVRVEREVRGKLGGEERRGRLSIAREGSSLSVRFSPASLLGEGGTELTPAAKQALCRLKESLTLMGPVRLRVRSQLDATPAAMVTGSFRDASARAASAADVLVNTCGAEAASVSVLVEPARSAGAATTRVPDATSAPATPAKATPPDAPLSLELEPA